MIEQGWSADKELITLTRAESGHQPSVGRALLPAESQKQNEGLA
jgi:hypothetical protein